MKANSLLTPDCSRSRCNHNGNRRLRLATLIAVILSILGAQAQQLRFLRRAVDIPGSPLELFLPAGAEPVALPPPQVNTYRITSPDGSQRLEERFDVRQLWRLTQRIGVWTTPEGHRLELADVVQSAPTPPVNPPHGLRADFDAWWETHRRQAFDDRPERLRQWVADFTDAPDAAALPMTRPPMALRDLTLYEWEASPRRLGGVFRFNTLAAGQSQAGNTWYFFLIDAAEGTDPQVLRREIADRFLPSIRLATLGRIAPPLQADEAPAFDNTVPLSNARLESRRQVIDGIRNLSDWQYEETDHYLILANTGPRSGRLVDRLQAEMDPLREAYTVLVPPPREITEVSVIRLFADAGEYGRYVGDEYAWSGGLWAPSRREMVIRHPQRGLDRDGIEQVVRIVRHEAFHQYLHYAFDRLTPCAWFNEGHAVFFEHVRPAGRRTAVDPHATYMREMIRLAESDSLDLPRLLAMDYPTFYDPDETQRRDNYALAWGLIYYLRMAAPLTESAEDSAAVPTAYINALRETRNGAEATRRAWQDIDMQAFTQTMKRFWTSPMQRSRAGRQRIFDVP